eukprot:55922-Eustigmatos_ZCMA.PRE.1
MGVFEVADKLYGRGPLSSNPQEAARRVSMEYQRWQPNRSVASEKLEEVAHSLVMRSGDNWRI